MVDTCWRELLKHSLKINGESEEDIVGNTATDKQMDYIFRYARGEFHGFAFTVWTNKRVYFPSNDGYGENVRSVPRHPCNETTSPWR